MKIILMCLSIVITALGISLEVEGKAWMLAGEMTVAAVADSFNVKFRNAKIFFDVFLVVIAAAIAWFCFGSVLGNGSENVIREGTIMSALLTGVCMKFTDRLIKRILPAKLSARLK